MNPFSLVPLIENIPQRIASLGSWEDKIYVGTTDGCVLLYSTHRQQLPSGKVSYTVQLKNKKDLKHGKKPVEQLEVFPEFGKLVTLCDGKVDVLNLYHMEIGTAVTKDALSFCSKKQSKDYWLCVQVKSSLAAHKKLLLFEFTGSYEFYKEISIPDTVISMEWIGHFIFVGTKKEYMTINVETGVTNPLAPVDKDGALIHSLEDELVFRNETTGVFLNKQGNPIRGTIAWSQPPKYIGYLKPYVVGCSSRKIDVHCLLNMKLVQQLAAPSERKFKIYAECLGTRFLCGSNTKSTATVYSLELQSVSEQINDLVQARALDDAVELTKFMFGNKPELVQQLNSITEQAGFFYLADLQFAKAFESFTACKVQPLFLLSCFPHLNSPNSSYTGPKGADLPEALAKAGALNRLSEVELLLLDHLEKRTCPPEAQRDVSTSLVLLLLRHRRKSLVDFLKTHPPLHIAELEEPLEKAGAFFALGFLYSLQQSYRKALKVWQKLSRKELVDDDVQPEVAQASAIELLRECESKELIWEFGRWLFDAVPDQALLIFTSPLRKQLILHPDDVLEFLTPYGAIATQQYLHYLISETGNTEERYHSKLTSMYIDAIQALGNIGFAPIAGQEPGLLGLTRVKLISLLQTSKFYNPKSVLARIKDTPLNEELVSVYFRLGDYRSAFDRLVKTMNDFPRAERWCLEHSDEADENNLFLILLQLLIEATMSSGAASAEVLKFLDNHPTHLDPSEVLAVLPSTTPLSSISKYLQSALLHRTHQLRTGKIVKNLAKVAHLNAKVELTELTSACVEITPGRACAVCKRPLGENVFARYPNGVVVHYKCMKDPTIDPITGKNFTMPY